MSDAHAPAQLRAILAELGLELDEPKQLQLLQYLDLLQRWNQVYNLTAVRDPGAMLTLHLADSLAVLPALQRRGVRRVLDVGSGGGLPGIVLAIAHPEWSLVLAEAVQKKCAFLRQVAATLGLRNVEVVHGRIENARLPGFDCITSRAVGELAELVRISEHLLLPGGVWAAMKGVPPEAELQALPSRLAHEVEAVAVPGLDARRCLVWITPQASAATTAGALS